MADSKWLILPHYIIMFKSECSSPYGHSIFAYLPCTYVLIPRLSKRIAISGFLPRLSLLVLSLLHMEAAFLLARQVQLEIILILIQDLGDVRASSIAEEISDWLKAGRTIVCALGARAIELHQEIYAGLYAHTILCHRKSDEYVLGDVAHGRTAGVWEIDFVAVGWIFGHEAICVGDEGILMIQSLAQSH